MHRTHTRLFHIFLGGFLCAFIFSPSFVFAQIPTDQAYEDNMNKLLKEQVESLSKLSEVQKGTIASLLDVSIYPPMPGPNTEVQIAIDSYIVDLLKANISWSLDGKLLSRGIGRTAFNFKTGPSGKSTHVSLYFVANTGEAVTKEFYFTPVGVTIMWEADTYTPPFYKGKAMMVPQARVRIIAIPDITNTASPLGAGKLVYNWEKDEYPDVEASGYGKNTYSFTGPEPLTNNKVTLTVSSLDDTMQSSMNVFLPQAKPFILFYEKDPLLGVLYNKPLDTETALTKKEVSLSAEPYYFSNERGDTPIFNYTWSVNGQKIQNYGRTITLRNDAEQEGRSLVSLSMNGISKIWQTAKRDLQVNFATGTASERPNF